MTEGYWLKGSACVNIRSELHISAIIRNPSLYGIATDIVTFAFDQHGRGDEFSDLLIAKVLNNGWIKIRHFVGPDIDQWEVVFAEYAKSRLEIVQFLRSVLPEESIGRSNASLGLQGLEDGFQRDYDQIEGGCSKYLKEEASISG